MSNEEASYSLIMPFVACVSQGGPYPDDAFVAGYTAASLDAQMEHGHEAFTHCVPPALLPQLDLIAMRRGWALTHARWDEYPEEWAFATFCPPSPEPLESGAQVGGEAVPAASPPPNASRPVNPGRHEVAHFHRCYLAHCAPARRSWLPWRRA